MLSVGTTGVKMRANVQDGLKKKNRQQGSVHRAGRSFKIFKRDG